MAGAAVAKGTRASRHRQRGSAAVFGAIAAIAGLSAVALAIDLGRVYFAQRDLQRLANMAALDSARVAGGCLGLRDNPDEAAFNEALLSLDRNGGEASYLPASGLQLGRKQTGAGGLRYFESGEGEKSRAVQVSLTRPFPTRLIPLMAGEQSETPPTLRAVAAAFSSPQATVVVGSKLAELDPDLLNRVLSNWLGGPVAFDAMTYRNLFGATVPLNGITEPTSIGAPDREPQPPVPLPDLLENLARALAHQGNGAAQAAAQQMADVARDDRTVALAEIIGLEPGYEEPARQATLQVGTLILSAAEVANGTNLVDFLVPAPPPAQDGSARLRIIEAARQSILSPGDASGAYARNAQGILEATLPIDVTGAGRANLRLFLQTAEATAEVEEILCARRGQTADIVEVGARSSIVRIGIGEFDDINAPSPEPRPATLLDLTVDGVPVRITGFAYANLGRAANESLEPFIGPFDEDGITQSLGTPAATAIAEGLTDVARTLELRVELPPGLPTATAAVITAQLQPLINARLRPALVNALNLTGRDLLQDVAGSLGLTLGGADVTVLKVLADEPYLFTR